MIYNHTAAVAHLEAAGVTIPKDVTKACDLIGAARAVVIADPTKDLTHEYASGTLTTDNVAERMIKAATIAAGAERIHLAAQTVEAAATPTIRTWIKTDADKIVTQLRPLWDEAALSVQTAGQHFPPNASAEQILTGGAPAAAAYERLAEALATLERVRNCRADVADVAGEGAPHAEWFIAEARDIDALEQARRAYAAGGFHGLAHAGFTLRLNTATEAERVRTGAQASSDAREQAERAEQLAKHQQEWAPYLASLDRLSPTFKG